MNPPANIRTFFEIQPLFPVVFAFAIVVFAAVIITWLSIRDSNRLPNATSVLLVFLRLFALVVLTLFVLNPGKRSETKIVKRSRLPILIDTSLSMGLQDDQQNLQSAPRRIDELIAWLEQDDQFQRLAARHDVSVYRFGETAQPELIHVSDNSTDVDKGSITTNRPTRLKQSLVASRLTGTIATILLVIALGLILYWGVCWVQDSNTGLRSIVACAMVILIVISLTTFGWADLQSPEFPLLTSLGWRTNNSIAIDPDNSQEIKNTSSETNQLVGQEMTPEIIDWAEELAPRGTSTKIGAAVQSIVNRERGGPIAGLLLITDGRNNSGARPSRSIATAANAGISIFPIGIGSDESPKNVRVVDVQAPPRVFPSDKFQVKGMIKAYGLAGTTIAVQLLSIDEAGNEAETVEDETAIRLLDDGKSVPVDFSVSHLDQGKRRYIIRAGVVPGDLDPRDNERTVLVEIIDRQTQVLLIAGGPMREFRFLRNQLHRDKDILLHVWLQSAKAGSDQESDVLLQDFPSTREQLFEFDCVIAFDPDWRLLSTEQTNLLERWVAEQAGGLIVVAGPVNTPEWTRRPRGDEAIDKVRRLYPVSFYSQGSAQLKLGRFGGTHSYQLDFTREGRAAEYLWLGDSATESQSSWDRFDGVFGYYAVNEPKAGADILANFADPTTAVDERLPIYLASQFYGAGRVFFQASGEMWRVRRLEVEYFQDYYTKLIRWASQGRLLRDSTRGVLLTDRQRCWMGDQVSVQAILRDEQDQPLMVPEVNSVLLRPDGATEPLNLRTAKNAVRPGSYSGFFTASMEGEYRVSLPIPASSDLEILNTVVQSSIPDLEKEKPQRNDALLSEMAEKTGGHYYVGLPSFLVADDDPLSPMQLIQPQDQVTFLTGTLNVSFQRKLMMWLLILFTSVLAFEWIVRRLNKLA